MTENKKENWEEELEKDFWGHHWFGRPWDDDQIDARYLKSFIHRQREQAKEEAEFELNKLQEMTIRNKVLEELLKRMRREIEKMRRKGNPEFETNQMTLNP